MNYVDLTQTFTQNMPVYPGDPEPELVQSAHIDKNGYNEYQIKTGMHVGTHMDGPLHMIPNGKKLSEIAVEKFFGRGVLVDARGKEIIDRGVLDNISIKAGDIVLVMTGFSEKFGKSEYYEKYPEISENLAEELIKLGVKMLCLDSPSPDRPPFKIHKLLLKQEILIVENLTKLESLIGIPNLEIFALPAKLDTDSAPVRVIAKIF